MIPWSYSRLTAFEKCPKQFHHVNIIKDVPFRESDAMKRGSVLHEKLDRAALRIKADMSVDTSDIPHVVPIIREFFATHDLVRSEARLAFLRTGGSCGYYDKRVWWRCVLDLVGLKGDSASIIDWKTGRVNMNADQLKLCGLAVLLNWPHINTVHAVLMFVDHQVNSPIVMVTRDRADVLLHEYEDRAEALQIAEEKNEWPPTPNRECKWCDCPCRYRS